MSTKTVCCKLKTTPEIAQVLQETSERFASSCNFVLAVSMEHKTSHAIALHQLCYKKCRVQFGLSANLAIRSIRRTAHCLTRLKRKRKPPRHFSPKSIDYDARIFTYNDEKEIVSLTTTRGRVRIPLILGGFQRNLLKGKSPTAAQVIKKGGFWYIHIVVEVENAKLLSNSAIGIDCGITNLVATSNGTIIEGKTRQNFKQLRAKIRASLQSKGSKGSKKILKRLSGKENRRIRYENHVIAKQIVEEAQRHNCGLIRMERLTHIRQRTKTWNKHLNKMVAGWSFFQLQQFVAYKAEEVGIAIEFVDPAYTSQTCHKCLCLGSRTGERFTCLTCGEQHADVNASRVVALGGAACKPARISTLPKD